MTWGGQNSALIERKRQSQTTEPRFPKERCQKESDIHSSARSGGNRTESVLSENNGRVLDVREKGVQKGGSLDQWKENHLQDGNISFSKGAGGGKTAWTRNPLGW